MANIINDPAQFVPYFYISVGETGAFFTLWKAEMEVVGTRYGNQYVMRHHYFFNLSQDANEAFRKATDFANHEGTELKAWVNIMQQEMRDIERASAEQLKAREEKILAKKAEQEAHEAAIREAQLKMIAEGKYPFGRYYDVEFNRAPESYITWLVNNQSHFEEGSVIRLVSEAVAATCQDMVLPTPDLDLTVGTVGKRDVFDVVVIRRTGYATQYGWTNVITMVDKSGACIVSKGTFDIEVGKKVKIKGTVKQHDRYKDQMQTQIQRVVTV